MTSNLKIYYWNISTGNNFLLNPSSTDPDKSTLRINLQNDLEVWDNAGSRKGTIFPVDADPANNVNLDDIWYLKITGSTKILEVIRNLVFLKHHLNPVNYHFQLVIDKNLGDQWDIVDETDDRNGQLTLRLSEADFGGSLEVSKIIIDNVNYKDDGIENLKSYEAEKQALLDLEKLLNETLPRKYLPGHSPDLSIFKFNSGPDIELIDPSIDLGNPTEYLMTGAGVASEATGLLAYSDGVNTKHDLYNLDDFDYHEIYKDKIDNWIKHLETVRDLLKIKVTKSSEVSILLAEGYDGEKEELKEQKKQPGLYKGFLIFDPNLEVFIDSSDNKFKAEKKDPNKIVRYTKENIDNFRTFIPVHTENYYNILIATRNDLVRNDKGVYETVEVFTNSDPRDCLGFQPGDISLTSDRNNKCYVNTGYFLDGSTKMHFDILGAQNAQEAMDLAFFGKDYDQAQSDFNAANRKDNPKNGWVKTPNINLKFNEVRIWTPEQTLEHYYEALKDEAKCKWTTPGDDAGNGAIDAPKYKVDSSGVKNATAQEIDNNYQLATEWIRDYKRWTDLSGGFASLGKADLENVKKELTGWKGTRFYTPGGAWKPVIDNFLTEVNGALSRLDDDDENDIPAWKTELAGLKNRGSSLAQKIYQNCQPDQDGFTEAVFGELKKLVKLLEEAHGTKTSNTKSELEKFISDGNNKPNQKKALEIAKKVKNQDSDSVGCVATALEKLKTLSEKKLESTRQQLKNLLTGLKIGDKDAYEVVVANIKGSEDHLLRAIKIWQKLSEVDSATEDDKGELLDALNNLHNDSLNKEAWEAINQYKKNNQGSGYCDDMLKKLNDWATQRRKDYQAVKSAKTKAEFLAAKAEFIKKHEYTHNQQDYDEIYFPLAEKAVEIREKGTSVSSDEKDLVGLITTVVSEFTDWKTQLTDLENKFNQLKDYAKGGSKHSIISLYSLEQKKAFNKLVGKMEAKLKEWQAEKNSSAGNHNNPASEASPWYKNPLVIIGIAGVALVLAGVIWYLMKSKDQPSSEEQL